MTEQTLIEKIINDAKKDATMMIDTATAAALQKVESAKLDASSRKQKAIDAYKKEVDIRKDQIEKAAEVDIIKARINAKQSAVGMVFDAVEKNITGAAQTEIKTVVKGLVKKYGKTGDTVLVGKAWAKAVPDYKATDKINAGIIIQNKNYEIDLSVGVLAENLRNRTALKVSEMLA